MKPDFKGFADALMSLSWNGDGADGADIQDLGVQYGLLEDVVAGKRCGKTCACAEYGEFPAKCYRKTYK